MPTYEYACKACDHAFEIVQSFSEDSLTTCPECDRDELRKVYNAAGIIFKGDGWHIKDYGKSKTSSAAASDTTAANDGGASSSDGSSATKDSSSTKDASGSKDASSAATPDAAKKAS